ncbi:MULTISPECIES: hypothetical protein [unclassified Paenibacillus]|uniref:hypothetical protein n=1 Tax=unclassified Paenibacillus TaxID=185978 RepID=UPI00117F5AAC|nr:MULTISPECIES: hypothetical protein [unclassified Paenibacillus]
MPGEIKVGIISKKFGRPTGFHHTCIITNIRGTINLRNAEYTEGQIKVGYEVNGFSLKEYNVSCKLYNDGNLISSSGSTDGGLIELDEQHYYFVGFENIDQVNLPDSINLTVEITVIPNDSGQKPLTASFNVDLDKEM